MPLVLIAVALALDPLEGQNPLPWDTARVTSIAYLSLVSLGTYLSTILSGKEE